MFHTNRQVFYSVNHGIHGAIRLDSFMYRMPFPYASEEQQQVYHDGKSQRIAKRMQHMYGTANEERIVRAVEHLARAMSGADGRDEDVAAAASLLELSDTTPLEKLTTTPRFPLIDWRPDARSE